MLRFTLFAMLLGGSLLNVAAANGETNQSLIMADLTCQRVVLNGTGEAPPSEPLLEDLLIAVEYGLVDIDDRFLGKGAEASSVALSLSATVGERWQLFGMAGRDRYRWDGDAFRLEGDFVALATTVETLYGIRIGPFVEMADIDTELQGDRDRATVWAAGLLASRQFQVEELTIGLSSTLASMNKRHANQLLEQQDSAFAAMLDARYPLGRRFAVTGYTYYYTLLDNPRPSDGHYWLFGGELEYRPAARWIATVGYSVTAANRDYRAETLLFQIAYQF